MPLSFAGPLVNTSGSEDIPWPPGTGCARSNGATRPCLPTGAWDHRSDDGSRMNREVHVRFWESAVLKCAALLAYLGPVYKHVGRDDVERCLLGHSYKRRKENLFRVPPDHFQHRLAHNLLFGDELGEDRRLENAQADIEADPDQNDAEEERHAPAPGDELVARNSAERQECQVREQQAARHAELRP